VRVDACTGWTRSGAETRRRDNTAGPLRDPTVRSHLQNGTEKGPGSTRPARRGQVLRVGSVERGSSNQCINWDANLLQRHERSLGLVELLRKEVIQPHLPVRLPCYDFTPIAGPTFDGSLLAVGPPASGVTNFRGVTGGVYKARERIHPGVADPGLLATPTSRSRVADSDPN
jgi:hypothetical protein